MDHHNKDLCYLPDMMHRVIKPSETMHVLTKEKLPTRVNSSLGADWRVIRRSKSPVVCYDLATFRNVDGV